jgi:hypothetical protein
VKHSRRSSRVLSSLSDSVHLRLDMYALAASTAGVGALALARPSEAEIVYTPAQVTIRINKTIPLDLNHDGKTDFCLPNVWGTAEATGVGASNALPAQQSNGVGDLERLFSAVPTPTRSGLVIGLDPARNSILESIFTCSTQMPPSDATVLGMR